MLRGIIKGPVDPDQAWFWTPEWQAGERKADAEIAAGEGPATELTRTSLARSTSAQARRMPTYEVLASFWRDWPSLTPQQQRAFRRILVQFIADLRSERSVRPYGSSASRAIPVCGR